MSKAPDKKSQRFDVHVTKGAGPRGSKLWSVLVVAALLLIGGAGYYFWVQEEKLANHLRNRDGLAVAAAWAIYLKGAAPEVAFDPLLKASEAPDPGLRKPAVHALGTYGRREIVAPLMQILADDSDHGVRAAAASALGKNGNSENPLLQGAIKAALTDAHSEVRVAAATAAGDLHYDDLIPDLIGMLGDTQRTVKTAAKRSLESFTPGDESYEFNRQAWMEWYDGRR
jgi:HEAT repeat protein